MKTRRIERNQKRLCVKQGHNYEDGFICVNCDKVNHRMRIQFERDSRLLESIKEKSPAE